MVAPRPVLPIAGKGAEHESGVDRLERRIAAAELVHHTGAEALQYYVGGLGQRVQLGHVLGLLEVERHRLFAAIDEREQLRREQARVIPGARFLDLDDLRTQLREVERAEGAGQQAAQVENGEAGKQWVHGY